MSAALRKRVLSKRREFIVLAPVIALAIWASCWVAVTTADHIGKQYDSASYLGTAAELRSWHGPVVPSTFLADDYPPQVAASFGGHVPSSHFPPGYPIALALTSIVTGGIDSAARLLGIVLVFVNVMLVGVLTARMTAYRSLILPALPAALLLFTSDWTSTFDNPGWLGLHAYVYSEPLFIAVAMCCLLMTATAVSSSVSRSRHVWAAAAFASIALATRYVGVAVLLTLGIALIFFAPPAPRFASARRASVVCLAAVAPTFAFLVWSFVLGGQAVRVFGYHPRWEVYVFVRRLEIFFFPASWPTAVRTTAFIILAGLMLVGTSRRFRLSHALVGDDRQAQTLQHITLLFVACYIIVVYFTRTFLDAATPFNARLLSPIRGPIYAISIVVLYRLLVEHVRPVAAATALALLCGILIFGGWVTERTVLRAGTGSGTTPTRTELMVATLPKGALIVTDDAAGLYLAVERGSLTLPQRTVYVTGRPNHSFDSDMREWANLLRQRGGYVLSVARFCIGCPRVVSELLRLVPARLISESGPEHLYEVIAAHSRLSGPLRTADLRNNPAAVGDTRLL